jgi:hypothetical protein
MNDREIMEAAIRHMKEKPNDPDETKGFFRQLFENLRLKFTATKKEQSVNVSSSAKF